MTLGIDEQPSYIPLVDELLILEPLDGRQDKVTWQMAWAEQVLLPIKLSVRHGCNAACGVRAIVSDIDGKLVGVVRLAERDGLLGLNGGGEGGLLHGLVAGREAGASVAVLGLELTNLLKIFPRRLVLVESELGRTSAVVALGVCRVSLDGIGGVLDGHTVVLHLNIGHGTVRQEDSVGRGEFQPLGVQPNGVEGLPRHEGLVALILELEGLGFVKNLVLVLLLLFRRRRHRCHLLGRRRTLRLVVVGAHGRRIGDRLVVLSHGWWPC